MELLYYPSYLRPTELPSNTLFVFGSNLGGIHGAGAAKDAVHYFGAQRGRAIGMQGQSFGIPTKDRRLQTLDLDYVSAYVDLFLDFAKDRQDLQFFVTKIGCGLAGYRDAEIAPLFDMAPANCIFNKDWIDYFSYREPQLVAHL